MLAIRTSFGSGGARELSDCSRTFTSVSDRFTKVKKVNSLNFGRLRGYPTALRCQRSPGIYEGTSSKCNCKLRTASYREHESPHLRKGIDEDLHVAANVRIRKSLNSNLRILENVHLEMQRDANSRR